MIKTSEDIIHPKGMQRVLEGECGRGYYVERDCTTGPELLAGEATWGSKEQPDNAGTHGGMSPMTACQSNPC